jgi:hypothetical protein
MGERNENLVYTSPWDFKSSFTWCKILRHGTSGFTFHPKGRCVADFYRPKSIALAGFKPANFGPSGKHTNHYTIKAPDGGEWSASRPGRALGPRKGLPIPTVQEAGWAPEPVWTQRLQEKSFRIRRGSNPDRPVVQPVARHYTDWATTALLCKTYPA